MSDATYCITNPNRMCVLMVRMVSCVSEETNLLGHSKLEHCSDGNRFQCWMLHIALLSLTLSLRTTTNVIIRQAPAGCQLYELDQYALWITR